jgi:RHS repeat-associated protein
MEKDDEHSQGRYDFGARVYDSRLGRWLAVDGLVGKYPSLSPYTYVRNIPIRYIDSDGNEIMDPWSGSAVKITYDLNNKPIFKLTNGNDVSIEFLKRSQGTLMRMAGSEVGRKQIKQLADMPTEITIDRLADDPIKDDNSTVVPTDDGVLPSGHYTAVTIIPDYRRIVLSAAASNSKFEEVLATVMSVEIGHLMPSNIASAPKTPEAFKAMYEGLINDAIRERIEFRNEKKLPITDDVFQIFDGIKRKYPEKSKLLELDAENKELRKTIKESAPVVEEKPVVKPAKCWSCTPPK